VARTRPAADGDVRRLVIVESPAKARTIAGYLGPGYVVESSIGHIRDLPKSSAEIPADKKKESWARLGVDVEHGFEPLYIVNPDKRAQVAKLKSALQEVDELLLATDEDREGEAIAWHLLEVLKPRVPVRRMVFHEITPQAIREAVENPREIDRNLVDAQETRRVLDRLFGYEVSPVLWKKVMPRLSAGRVQSVATRLLVERERARMRFRSAGYWDLEADLDTGVEADGVRRFTATLASVDGVRVATGRDFDESGTLTAEVRHLDEAAAHQLAAALQGARWRVGSVDERPYRRSPYPPFITSTLQQEASRKLRFSAQVTMRLAQRLYENGYITYMRTDSTTLSDTALQAARRQARELYGADFVPDQPRRYERKVKNAQEAHEAIRPAGDSFRTPQQVRAELGNDEHRLYELIWQRTVASQMTDATGRSVTVRVAATVDAVGTAASDAPATAAEFTASGKVITFPGFLRAYVEETDDASERDDRERRLPPVRAEQPLGLVALEAQEHATNPPARYTEASLVKAMEELGIGRPSTYASIIGTIQDRGYVFKRGTALVPSFTAFAVVGLLEQHFSRLVDYRFTAEMEDDLDEIAGGARERVQWLTDFYFGGAADAGDHAVGLRDLVHERLGEIDAREVNSIPIGMTESGEPLVVRVGRYGPYVQKGADPETAERASVPDDLPPDELTIERALALLEKTSDERLLGNHPDDGQPILVRAGRYGPYVTTQPLDDSEPRTASLFKTMSPETVTLDDAVRLLSLPRVVGVDPATGDEVTAQNGRYGPYVKRGTESRSLEDEAAIFNVTLDGALALLAQPKTRGRRAAAAPLRELGPDPASGQVVTVREGRFGPYVTDGETNASLRKGDSIEEITIDRAAELLAERRAKGPATPRKRAAKKAVRKSVKKAAKKTAKKSATKSAKKTVAPAPTTSAPAGSTTSG
jgi:DNA topoisomerase-1